MSSFHLQIVTPDGLFYDGEAESLDVRTVTGGVTILPQHINYVAPLGMGQAQVRMNGTTRRAACMGGMVAVQDGAVRLIATTFEWQETIDLPRAQRALESAQALLREREKLSAEQVQLAEARLRRALVRTSLGGQ